MDKGKNIFESGPRNDDWSDKFNVDQIFKIKDQTVKVIKIKKLRKEIHLKVLEPIKKKEDK